MGRIYEGKAFGLKLLKGFGSFCFNSSTLGQEVSVLYCCKVSNFRNKYGNQSQPKPKSVSEQTLDKQTESAG